eukprot:1122021-Rhodomonas_salina.2
MLHWLELELGECQQGFPPACQCPSPARPAGPASHQSRQSRPGHWQSGAVRPGSLQLNQWPFTLAMLS